MDNVNATEKLPQVSQDFSIPEANLQLLQSKFNKLNRRAAKLGLEPIQLTVTGPSVVKHFFERAECKVEEANEHIAFIPITVSGVTPRMNGWDFVATLQHLGEDGNIIRSVPGLDGGIPLNYRTAKPGCDHCHTRRARIDTYVLREVSTGSYKQVGTNCLADFIRTSTVDGIVGAASILIAAMDAAEDAVEVMGGSSRGSSLVGLVELMSWVISIVRVDGAFVSKSKARAEDAEHKATVSIAVRCICGTGKYADEARADYRRRPEEMVKAEELVAWGRENVPAMLAEDETNDYLYNLSVTIRRDWLEYRLVGIAGSLIGVYNRDLARKAMQKMNKETLSASKHFGTVGERIRFLGATLLHTYQFETQYGITNLVKMLTDSGDVAIWFSSSGPLQKPQERVWTQEQLESAWANAKQMGILSPYADLKAGDVTYTEQMDPVENGERVVLNATVKKHDERDGIKQTVVTRCTVWTQLGIDQEMAKQAKKAAREAKKAEKQSKAVPA